MRYSLINGKKSLAQKGLTGLCPCCNGLTKAYCGDTNIHHWRHISQNDCDNWHEPITDWHISWQDQFPKEWQEIVINKGGQLHRADILTPGEVILEFQNSPISLSEAFAREKFYEK